MSPAEIKLPADGWVIQPSYRLKRVRLVEARQWLGAPNWFGAESGRDIHASEFYATREDAIAAGRAKLKEQEAALLKRQVSLAKKFDNLDLEERR